jgi:hypothetical protein
MPVFRPWSRPLGSPNFDAISTQRLNCNCWLENSEHGSRQGRIDFELLLTNTRGLSGSRIVEKVERDTRDRLIRAEPDLLC